MTRNNIDDLKVTYRVLHRHLAEYPDLMDSPFLDDLQRHLQQHAVRAGVDVADHGQWDAWLGGEGKGCDVRHAKV